MKPGSSISPLDFTAVYLLSVSVLHFAHVCSGCVYDCEVDEVDGLGFMMITLPKGVQNQSYPKPKCFHPVSTGDFQRLVLIIPPIPAFLVVVVVVVVCVCVGGLKDILRNGEMIMQSLAGVGALETRY